MGKLKKLKKWGNSKKSALTYSTKECKIIGLEQPRFTAVKIILRERRFKMSDSREWYKKGLRDGIPIALGYFAVAFTLGIVAKKAGFTALQAGLATGLTNASAGGYAGFTLIAAGAGYFEVALTELIVNARYLLMSCALSQKLSPDTSLLHRLLGQHKGRFSVLKIVDNLRYSYW